MCPIVLYCNSLNYLARHNSGSWLTGGSMSVTKPAGSVRQIYKFHWHILFTHFPVPLLTVAFGFQAADIIFDTPGFDLSTDLVFVSAVLILFPVVFTGWRTWKKSYKAAKIMLFQRKIATSWVMLAVGIPEAVWRVFMMVNEIKDTVFYDMIYFLGIAVLVAGSIVEGYYGSRLNHR